jgi:hypothetical protein
VHPIHTKWLDELEGVERPASARQILAFLCSPDEPSPYQNEPIDAKFTDMAITQARLTDTGKELVLAQASASRAWIKPILVYLHEQGATEAEQLHVALANKIPMLTLRRPPEQINIVYISRFPGAAKII